MIGNPVQAACENTSNTYRKFVSENVMTQKYIQDNERWSPYIIETAMAEIEPKLKKQLSTKKPECPQDQFKSEMENFIMSRIPEITENYKQQLQAPTFIEAADNDENMSLALGQIIMNQANLPTRTSASGQNSGRYSAEMVSLKETHTEGPTAESVAAANHVNQITRKDPESPQTQKQAKGTGNSENTGLGPPSGPSTAR